LSNYMMKKGTGVALSDYLNDKVFAEQESVRVEPDAKDVAGFEVFIERYKKGLAIERAAVVNLEG
ncbi:MAG: ATPase, partial [Lachnospiraceae bacterium]|nr:ATPase [Lachnospiraceae bacterium]